MTDIILKRNSDTTQMLLSKMPKESDMICTPRFISTGEQVPCLKEKCMAFEWGWLGTLPTREYYEGTNILVPDPTQGRHFKCLLVKPNTVVTANASSRSSIF